MTEERRRCLVCLGPLGPDTVGEYHGGCCKQLFGQPRVPAVEVDPESLHLFGQEMVGKVTISGVQRKVSLGFEQAALRVRSSRSRFILKPQDGAFPNLPENEHVTMLLAKRVGLSVAPSGLIRLRDGSVAFITRRFDREEDGRRLGMEDFCQLLELPPADKYEGSYERCAEVVARFSDAPGVDLLNLFRQVLFAWWTGNGDLHLKNLALFGREPGCPRLSPAYDLLCTRIPVPGDPLALTVAGKRDRLQPRDWLELAERCRLPSEVVEYECIKLLDTTQEGLRLLRESFLPSDQQDEYVRILVERSKELLELVRESIDRAIALGPRLDGLRPLDPRAVARCVHLLENEFAGRDVSLRESPLARELASLEWLLAEELPFFASGGAGVRSECADQFRGSLLSFVRLERVRRALTRLGRTPGVENKLGHLRNLRSAGRGGHADKAWALLFELELAAQLASPLWKVELREGDGEPDISIADAHGAELAVECKRPSKIGTVVRNVREAVTQLSRAGRFGFVAVDLSPVVATYLDARGADDSRSQMAPVLAQLLDPLRAALDEALGAVVPDLERRSAGAFGVLFCATPILLGRADDAGFVGTRTYWERHVHPSVEGADGLLTFIGQVAEAGQNELLVLR